MKVFLLSFSGILLVLGACGCAAQPAPVTGAQVIAAFKSAGLKAENVRPMTQAEYGEAPQVCSGTRFFVPSLGADNGGRVFICTNDKDRTALVNYYEGLARLGSQYVSWVYQKGNVVVQINGLLPNDMARKYEAAIP